MVRRRVRDLPPRVGLALDVQDGRDVGVCAEMAEYFVEAAVQRAARDAPA